MVYTETRPRGPIFIDFSGPGPAYSLPGLMGGDSHDPRSNHNKGPAYSMGGRWKDRKTAAGVPGPIYHPGDNLYKTGKHDGVSVSLKGRYKDKKGKEAVPGPGAYTPNNTYLSETKTGPAYSMGGRYRSRRQEDDTPGPNKYVPTFASREGKGFSLKGRYKEKSKDNSMPGPMAYKPSSGFNRYGRQTAPEASLKGRNEKLQDKSVVPGPGKYLPQTDSLSSSKSLPAWSLSSRHKELSRKDDVPGPNTYLPLRPSETSSAPAYSLGGKYKKQKQSYDDTPGPGKYNPDPKISIKGRTEGMSVTIKGRTRDRSLEKEKVPGPQSYQTNTPRESGPAFSMTGKPKTFEKEDLTPGPNQYFPTITSENNGPSLKGRYKDGDKASEAPGPGAYTVPEPGKMIPGPSYTMSGKWMDGEGKPGNENSPGPATYLPENKRPQDAGQSFGVRHSRAKFEGKMKTSGFMA